MTKGLIIALVVAVISAIGGIVLLGIPGAILFELASPFVGLVFGRDALNALPPDSMWPIAIVITLLWPISIVVGYLLAFRLGHNLARVWQIVSFAAILLLWDVVLSSACYMLGRQTV